MVRAKSEEKGGGLFGFVTNNKSSQEAVYIDELEEGYAPQPAYIGEMIEVCYSKYVNWNLHCYYSNLYETYARVSITPSNRRQINCENKFSSVHISSHGMKHIELKMQCIYIDNIVWFAQ